MLYEQLWVGTALSADWMRPSRCYQYTVINHIVHHRAQLGVYLRLNDEPVPSIYGPSADEPLGF